MIDNHPTSDDVVEANNNLNGVHILLFPLAEKAHLMTRVTLKIAVIKIILMTRLLIFAIPIECFRNGHLNSSAPADGGWLGAMSTQFSEDRDGMLSGDVQRWSA